MVFAIFQFGGSVANCLPWSNRKHGTIQTRYGFLSPNKAKCHHISRSTSCNHSLWRAVEDGSEVVTVVPETVWVADPFQARPWNYGLKRSPCISCMTSSPKVMLMENVCTLYKAPRSYIKSMIAGEEEELELHEQQTSRFFPSTGAFAIPLPVTASTATLHAALNWLDPCIHGPVLSNHCS